MNLFPFAGYSIEYHDSPTNAGGVALFVKDSLAYRVEKYVYGRHFRV